MWTANDKKPDELKIQELQERLERVERKLNELTEVTKEPNGEERYLDVGNACRYLNCGRTLIYELMKSGHLAYTQVGRQRRILLSDLVKYGQSNYKSALPSILP
jgi:excisionase family DNA binding protein